MLTVGLMMGFARHDCIGVAELARRAEALGYDSLWLPEHAVIPVAIQTPLPPGTASLEGYKHVPDPFVGLATAAGATTRLKLGTAICLVPERNPIVLAKEVATLDWASGGRFHFGIGAGWLREESELLGADFPRRWAQTRECVLAMKALWTQETASFAGTYVNFPPVWCNPKPVQRPHPPIVIGGMLPKAFERVADYGDGWMPLNTGAATQPKDVEAGRRRIEALFRERGRDASKLEVTLFGCRADKAEMQRWSDAGVTRILYVLRAEPPQATLERIEKLAAML
jgi:probable F420-dependent oxidoreductase